MRPSNSTDENMTTYISLLRGINVSGQKKIKMAGLVSLYEALGLKKVRTYVQSGNVIFDSAAGGARKLSQKIEEEIQKVFGFSVTVLIRTAAELQDVAENNLFLKKKATDITKLHVTFLSEKPDKAALKQLETIETGGDAFEVAEKHIYLYCPNGYGRTKLSNTFFEKKLKVAATTRNWNTVTALLEMAKK